MGKNANSFGQDPYKDENIKQMAENLGGDFAGCLNKKGKKTLMKRIEQCHFEYSK